jgi:hypothetical protein
MPEIIVISSDSNDSDVDSESPRVQVSRMSDQKKRAAKPEDPDHSRPKKRHASGEHTEIIEIIDSSDEDKTTATQVKVEPRDMPAAGKSKGIDDSKSRLRLIDCRIIAADSPSHEGLKKDALGRVVVTRKMKVDAVEHLQEIPSRWPVPTVDTAYVLDFSDDMRLLDQSGTAKGKPKGLDAFLKAEVCDY